MTEEKLREAMERQLSKESFDSYARGLARNVPASAWRNKAERDCLRDAMEDDWRPPVEVVRQLLDCIEGLSG